MKKNAWVVNQICETASDYLNRFTIPQEAVREVGYNTDHPVYIVPFGSNSLALTQDGSVKNVIGQVKAYGKNHTYQIHIGNRIKHSGTILVQTGPNWMIPTLVLTGITR